MEERRSLTGELLLSFARPAAGGSPLMWVNRSQRRRPPGLLGQKERPHHPHCSGTFTGCASRSASSSGYVCWSTGVCTAWHRRTSPTTSSRLLLLVPAVNSGPLTLRLWWSGPPDARRAFPVAAARAWNSLPPAVRDAPSLLSFRSRLKTWLFELTLA